MPVPVWQSASSAANTGGTSAAVVSVPSGSTSGDMMVAVAAWNQTDALATLPTVGAGWVNVVPVTSAGTLRSAVWVKPWQLGDTSYSFTPVAAGQYRVVVSRISGADTTIANWQTGTHLRASTGTSLTNVASARTASSAGGISLVWSTERTTATEGTNPTVSGATERVYAPHASGGIETIVVATVAYSGTSVPAVTFTYPNTQASNGIAGHLVIPEGVAQSRAVKLSLGDDTYADGQVWLADGVGGLDPIANLLSLPTGHRDFTVADMLAEDEFYWAHRGGSANWLEMTAQAYTNAVWHGAKCLEISVARSSDGQWVMHHDLDTGRMTGLGLGNGLVIASTSWATLSGLTQTGNGYSGPIERFSDYFATGYHLNAVTIVDNKTYANWTELLDFIESQFPGGRAEAVQRVIIKSFGGGTLGHLAPAASRGYTQWAYFYDADGQVNALDSRVNLIGLNWDASVTDWNYMLATGKPVIGHVVSSPAQAATALGKGAAGLQCSDVLTVVPKINSIPA